MASSSSFPEIASPLGERIADASTTAAPTAHDGSAQGGSAHGATSPGAATLRLDKFLWHARFFKSRTQAAAFVAAGRLRIGGAVVGKPHYAVRVGDVLTFALGPRVRVIRVLALGTRRGPAAEARQLYDDLNPPTTPASAALTRSAGQ